MMRASVGAAGSDAASAAGQVCDCSAECCVIVQSEKRDDTPGCVNLPTLRLFLLSRAGLRAAARVSPSAAACSECSNYSLRGPPC